ncbi:MAG: ATP-binding cassette domain-containing protein [Desulfobacterales bacterium]|nr:ATP-binding cassette domain-containing protein [Desulfobacterales bacterium]
MSKPIIQFVDVVKRFGPQVVLNRVNLEIPVGRTTVIAGQSGQGKSVTLRLILGLMRPDSGQVLVEGRDVARMSPRQLGELRTNFGVLFQGAALFDSLTVFGNVALPLQERTRSSRRQIRERVMTTLEQLDLAGHQDKYPAQLSGGMKKRVGLARALQLDPRIMLFDEPTTGLDPARTMEIYRLFDRTHCRLGYTAVIVSHDIPKVFNLADQVIILNDGGMKQFSSPEEIQWSDDPEIREFVKMTMGQIYQSQSAEQGL